MAECAYLFLDEGGKTEFYDVLKPAVRSEFDIFRTGTWSCY